MKLMIDIPEEEYKRLVYIDIFKLRGYIENGTPLPKGHGRLIDADELMALAHEEGAYDYVSAKEIADAPTIIEAEKEANSD